MTNGFAAAVCSLSPFTSRPQEQEITAPDRGETLMVRNAL
jgi:hypothetical protein